MKIRRDRAEVVGASESRETIRELRSLVDRQGDKEQRCLDGKQEKKTQRHDESMFDMSFAVTDKLFR